MDSGTATTPRSILNRRSDLLFTEVRIYCTVRLTFAFWNCVLVSDGFNVTERVFIVVIEQFSSFFSILKERENSRKGFNFNELKCHFSDIQGSCQFKKQRNLKQRSHLTEIGDLRRNCNTPRDLAI